MNNNLRDIFQEVANERGFDASVTLHVAFFHELKVIWMRSADNSVIDFWLNDYLADIDDEIAREMAEVIYSRIEGNNVPYGSKLMAYINDTRFLAVNRPKYLDRVNGYCEEGAHIDLSEVYQSLIEDGLLEPANITLGWGQLDNVIGHSSVCMKACVINRKLDNVMLPKSIVRFAVWSQVAFVCEEFDDNYKQRFEEWVEKMRAYPDYDEISTFLKAVGMKIYSEP